MWPIVTKNLSRMRNYILPFFLLALFVFFIVIFDYVIETPESSDLYPYRYAAESIRGRSLKDTVTRYIISELDETMNPVKEHPLISHNSVNWDITPKIGGITWVPCQSEHHVCLSRLMKYHERISPHLVGIIFQRSSVDSTLYLDHLDTARLHIVEPPNQYLGTLLEDGCADVSRFSFHGMEQFLENSTFTLNLFCFWSTQWIYFPRATWRSFSEWSLKFEMSPMSSEMAIPTIVKLMNIQTKVISN